MTEELEKEAEEYADWFWGASPSMMKALANAYIKGAEPREKRIAELEVEIERLKGDLELWESGACRAIKLDKCGVVKELKAQIEEMKSDVRGNIKWADQNKNDQMYCKLNAMINQWEIKEK